jgi:hypothetical protein
MGSFAFVDELRADALHSGFGLLPSAGVLVLEPVHEHSEADLGLKKKRGTYKSP